MKARNLQFLEPLESRIAPAGLAYSDSLGAYTYGSVSTKGGAVKLLPDLTEPTWTDASTLEFQGDNSNNFSVHFSKNVRDIFGSSTDSIFSFEDISGGGHKLDSIDLTHLGVDPKKLNGLSITISGGIDEIYAAGTDLGKITVGGALGKITAGDTNVKTQGVKSLSVDSLGLADGSEPSDIIALTSHITGSMGNLLVTHDIAKAVLTIGGSANANLRNVEIGGSLIGGNADWSGSIYAQGDITHVTVGGDLVGGTGQDSGVIVAGDHLNSVMIHGDVKGGAGDYSGVVQSNGKLNTVHLDGSLMGGDGSHSGMIHGHDAINTVLIDHNITGGNGDYSGRIESMGRLGFLSVGGDIQAGMNNYAGSVYAAGNISTAHIDGNLIGGAFTGTASLFADKSIGILRVDGAAMGGDGQASGYIQAQEHISKVVIGGSLNGGFGAYSGSVISFDSGIGSAAAHGGTYDYFGDYSGKFISHIDTKYLPYVHYEPTNYGGSVLHGIGYGEDPWSSSFYFVSISFDTDGHIVGDIITLSQGSDTGLNTLRTASGSNGANSGIREVISGTGNVYLDHIGTDASTMRLTGNNTYTGDTIINGGNLIVDRKLTGTTHIEIHNDGELSLPSLHSLTPGTEIDLFDNGAVSLPSGNFTTAGGSHFVVGKDYLLHSV